VGDTRDNKFDKSKIAEYDPPTLPPVTPQDILQSLIEGDVSEQDIRTSAAQVSRLSQVLAQLHGLAQSIALAPKLTYSMTDFRHSLPQVVTAVSARGTVVTAEKYATEGKPGTKLIVVPLPLWRKIESVLDTYMQLATAAPGGVLDAPELSPPNLIEEVRSLRQQVAKQKATIEGLMQALSAWTTGDAE